LIVLNLFVLEEGDDPHNYVGYAAVVLVLLRSVWGFVGGAQSRFSAFPVRPAKLRHFLNQLLSKQHEDYPGHNPAAAMAYIAIWACVILLGITGWMMGLDAFWGEEWLEEIHEGLSNGVMLLVGTHLVGIAFDSYKFRRRTWMGMITGRRDPW
jgi:cytochrome b